MKYMTFNSSCSYAGLANMLEKNGIDVEDYEIALEMKLPYMLDNTEEGYAAGPMLQQKRWFDIYLNSIGYEIVEDWIDKKDVFDFLKSKKEAMLGIRMENGRHHYHAVVFIGMEYEKAIFINNKHAGGVDPDKFSFTKEELEKLLRDKVVIGSLKPCEAVKIDIKPLLEKTISNLGDYQKEFVDFCSVLHSNKEILDREYGLFRPLLLDGPSMMELIKQDEILSDMKILQKIFVQVAFKEKRENVMLSDYLDMSIVHKIVENWKTLVREELLNEMV